MARRSLKDLQAKINQEENNKDANKSGGLFYPHWKLPFEGTTRIRFIEDPDENNDYIVYLPYMEHKLHIGEDQVRVPCLKNKGKDHNCPICEVSQKYYKTDNKKKGKYYYRDLSCIFRAFVTKDGLEYGEDEESAKGQVKAFRFSFQPYKKLEAEIAKLAAEDDECEFWDLEEGLDFAIVKDKQNVNGNDVGKYDLSSGFVRKPTALPEEWLDRVPEEPLSTLIPEIPSYDEADEILQKHLKSLMEQSTGTTDDDDDDADSAESEDELMAKINRRRAAKKEESKKEETKSTKSKKSSDDDDAPVAEASDDDDDDNPLSSLNLDDDDDDDDDDILAQLKG